MGVFYRSRSIALDPAKRVIHEAVRKTVAGGNVEEEVEKGAKLLAKEIESELRPGSFGAALGLLAVMAVFALWAEGKSMTTATENLWTAFQTILGVIVGFLGGEATGRASK